MSESQLPEQMGLDTARLFTVPALSSGPSTTTPSSMQPSQLASGVPWAPQATLQELAPDYLGHAEAAAYLASQQQQRQQQQQQQQQQLPMQTMLGTSESSPPPPKKRGRPSGSSKTSRDGAPEDRASSIQEKNRQAQARFRERQKEKMCILEARVQDLEARNKQLMDEMRALDGRKSVLEKVLSMKDEKIQQLENGATILNSVCMERPKDVSPPCIPTPGSLMEIHPEGQAVAAATRGQDLVSQWKHQVEKLSGLLLGLAKGECLEEVVGPQVDEIMTTAFRMFRGTCISDPMGAQTLLSTPLNASDTNVAEKPDHWQSVVRAMALSEAQVQSVQRLTLQFKARMVALWNSRESFSALAITGPTELTSCRLLAARTLKASDVLTRLQGAMLLETREHFEYVAAVLDEVLTKRQLANACAASYPYFPDPLTFCNLLESPAARPDFQ